jgi:hypothetical protein
MRTRHTLFDTRDTVFWLTHNVLGDNLVDTQYQTTWQLFDRPDVRGLQRFKRKVLNLEERGGGWGG